MYEIMMKMLIILSVIVVMVLPFQKVGSAEFIISLVTIGINCIGLIVMRGQLKKQKNSRKQEL